MRVGFNSNNEDLPGVSGRLRFRLLTGATEDQLRQITALYRNEGWWGNGPDEPNLVARIVSGSHVFAVACLDDEIIAMGRAISDRTSDAYIQDVTVHPRYRGRGIGTRLVQMLTQQLRADGIGWIGLVAERGSRKFYERLGFQKMKNADPMLRLIS